jgi:hypothetical protein
MISTINLSELNIGDVIYPKVVINPTDTVPNLDAKKESTTAKA